MTRIEVIIAALGFSFVTFVEVVFYLTIFMACWVFIGVAYLSLNGEIQFHCDKFPGERDECYLTTRRE